MTEQQILQTVCEKLAHRPKIIEMFKNCYSDTLENTIRRQADGMVFMLTGDIPAMWLRDSTNQLRPYLLTAKDSPKVAAIIEGVLKKQLRCMLRDPYANAFNEEENGAGHQTDVTRMLPDIWERKYEVDSLCYPLQLAYLYWKNTDSTAHFDGLFLSAAKTVVDLWKLEQYHGERSDYTFERIGKPHTCLAFGGKGTPVGYTGMTWSGFRPSDDVCMYGYLIPSNMFAVVVLDYLKEILPAFYKEETAFLQEVSLLREQIQTGIETYGIVESETFGKVYAFETDGLGNYNRMDDANVPSLLSMPYFSYCKPDDALYRNTRKMVLSAENPYYYEGTAAKGIGSPHTPQDYIWHIALSIQGLTSVDDGEKEQLLDWFETTDAGTNLVHEGFHKDDPTKFTRKWFSWSNAMFVEFVLSVCGLRIRME